jgi:antitoxin ParD1/3/4
MRSSIDIDDALLHAAMKAGSFSTKKAAVEAGLLLLARQAAYRELLALEGKLMWDEDAKDGDLLLKMMAPGAAES